MSGRVIIPGGSGVLGRELAPFLLAAGYEPIVLSRSASGAAGGVRTVAWDGRTLGAWADLLDGSEALVNLAGSNATRRHTRRIREEAIRSRIESTGALGQALRRCRQPPRVWVQASGIAYYGDTGDRAADESARWGDTFLAEVCRGQEGAFERNANNLTRTVTHRIGVALSRAGGAFPPLQRLARWGLGGSMGSGRQYFSWVHALDVLRAIEWSIRQPIAAGVYNLTAPRPVTNAELMRSLRRHFRRPWCPPAPVLLIRAGAVLADVEASLLLGSIRVVPARLLGEGFRFRYSELPDAIADLARS
jgi:uncharacterized protein